MMAMDPAELERIRASCTRWLAWHGNRSAADMLAELPPDIEPDRYGEGGVVEQLEAHLARKRHSLAPELDLHRGVVHGLGEAAAHHATHSHAAADDNMRFRILRC